jgi:hypothetical protein
MEFDFSKITVGELDTALEEGRFRPKVRAVIAKVTGKTIEDVNAMNPIEYKKILANFLKAAYAPVDADPN